MRPYKTKAMKITEEQKRLIQDYLDYYYFNFNNCKEEKLSLKNQIQLIYDYTSNLLDSE